MFFSSLALFSWNVSNSGLLCSVLEQCACVLCADDLLKLLNDFYRRPEVRRLAAESGLDGKY